MSPTSQRGDDIRDHLLVAGIVGHQVAVDRGDSARGGRIGVAAVVEGRQMDGERSVRRAADCRCGQGARLRRAHGVPDRAQLQGDQIVELIAPVGGRGQPQPPPSRHLPHRVLERSSRNVMALVHYDEAVARGQLRKVVTPRQGLQRHDIDGAAHRAELAERASTPSCGHHRVGPR